MTLTRLRELHAKGTQGEWEAVLLDDLTDATYVDGPGFASARAISALSVNTLQPQIHADAALIAATHNALPALLDALEAADELDARIANACETGYTGADALHEAMEAYRAARAKL